MTKMLRAFAGAALLALSAMTAVQASDTAVGDWTVTCDDANVCFAQMTGNGPRVILGRDKQADTLRIAVIVTVKAKVNQPVTLRLDNATLIYLKVNGCNPNYCEAVARLEDTQRIVARMYEAKTGVVSFLETTPIAVEEGRLPGESIALQLAPLSFNGFAAALNMVMQSANAGG